MATRETAASKKKKKKKESGSVLAYQTAGAPPSNLNGPRWSPFESQYAFVAVNHLRLINIMLPSIDFFPPLPPGLFHLSMGTMCDASRTVSLNSKVAFTA